MPSNNSLSKTPEPGITPQVLSLWIFAALFFVIGILNFFMVDIRPGFLYGTLALLYLPSVHRRIEKWIGFRVPFFIKVIGGLVVLWGTLAVGELAELFGL